MDFDVLATLMPRTGDMRVGDVIDPFHVHTAYCIYLQCSPSRISFQIYLWTSSKPKSVDVKPKILTQRSVLNVLMYKHYISKPYQNRIKYTHLHSSYPEP